MNLGGIRRTAKEKMKGYCNVCPICDGVACAGDVPGMGGIGTGQSFKSNIEDLSKIKIKLKTIHNAKNPDFTFNLFGHNLSMPIISAPITGTEFNMGGALTEQEYIDDVVLGSINAGTLAMIGDSADPELFKIGLNSVNNSDGMGIAILKPKNNEKIIESISIAKENNFIAAGIDIDGAGLITMALQGSPVGPKTPAELKEIIDSTDLPFILKGIMTVDEALLAVEVGADAIVVSNHGGRVLDYSESTARVLSDIANTVKGKITILVDGGVRSGTDVFKMIALGADAVLIGRPIVIGAFGGRKDGVSLVLDNMKDELLQTMILTGAKDLNSINKEMITIPWEE